MNLYGRCGNPMKRITLAAAAASCLIASGTATAGTQPAATPGVPRTDLNRDKKTDRNDLLFLLSHMGSLPLVGQRLDSTHGEIAQRFYL